VAAKSNSVAPWDMGTISAPNTCKIKNDFMRNMKHPNRACRDVKRFSFKTRLQAMVEPDLLLGQFLSPWLRNQPNCRGKPT
jgi:hypothetical protein